MLGGVVVAQTAATTLAPALIVVSDVFFLLVWEMFIFLCFDVVQYAKHHVFVKTTLRRTIRICIMSRSLTA